MIQETNLLYQDNFLDLTLLNEIGQKKLIEFYKELLKQFAEKKVENEFYRSILWLSDYNEQHKIIVDKDICISKLTDEMYNDVL